MADDSTTPELLVVSYPNEQEAEQALHTLQQLGHEHVVHLKDAAYIVRRQDGHLSIHETKDFTPTTSTLAGAVAGGLIGYLASGKKLDRALEGAALGGAGGFAAGKAIDLGFKDSFLDDVGKHLQPGTSAIVAVVHFDNVDQALNALAQYPGGKVLRQNLPGDVAQQVSSALGG